MAVRTKSIRLLPMIPAGPDALHSSRDLRVGRATAQNSASPLRPGNAAVESLFAAILFARKGARKTEALLRFNETWLEPDGCFVVRDCVLKFTNTAKQICKLFVDQSKVWIN